MTKMNKLSIGLAMLIVTACSNAGQEISNTAAEKDQPHVLASADKNVTDKITEPDSSQTAQACLLYTSPSPRDQRGSRMPSSA